MIAAPGLQAAQRGGRGSGGGERFGNCPFPGAETSLWFAITSSVR